MSEELYEAIEKLRAELPYLRKEFDVKSVGLFGSLVRGEETEESDVDVLVEFDRPIGLFKFMELESYLSETLGAEVDLVTRDSLNPLIRPKVEGEAVYV